MDSHAEFDFVFTNHSQAHHSIYVLRQPLSSVYAPAMVSHQYSMLTIDSDQGCTQSSTLPDHLHVYESARSVGIYVPCSLGRLVVVFSSLSFSSRPVSCSISVSFLLYQHDRSLLPNPTFYSVAVSFYLFCFCLIVPSLVVNIIVLASCARRVHGHSVESWSKFFVYCPVSIYYHMLPALIVVGKQEKNGIIQRQPTTHVVSLSLQVTHAP